MNANLNHNQIKGLQIFISDIRKCETLEAEQKRVDDELDKIRKNFSSEKTMSGYEKKKNIWKLCYIYVLGYRVDFGLNYCLDLITSIKYSEKLTGYLSLSIFLRKESPELNSMLNCVKNDLVESSSLRQCLALTLAANLPNPDLLSTIANLAAKFMTNFKEKKPDSVKLALVVLQKIVNNDPSFHKAEAFVSALIPMVDMKYFAVMQGLCSLVLNNIRQFGSEYYSDIVNLLFNKIVFKLKECPPSYIYHRVKAPWLQLKVLKMIQLVPVDDMFDDTVKNINEYLVYIAKKVRANVTSEAKIPRMYSEYSIFFECINVIDCLATRIEIKTFDLYIDILSKMLQPDKKGSPNKDVNTKYLSLESLAKLVKFSSPNKLMEIHQTTIFNSLKDNDISIRRRALDLLYLLCTEQTVKRVAYELICYLRDNEPQMKQDIVLKLAILAEKYGNDYFWYVDTMLNVILISGKIVSEDILFRFLQVVVGFEDQPADRAVQEYVAERVTKLLNQSYLFNSTLELCANIIGEFNQLIADKVPVEKIADRLVFHLENSGNSATLSVINALMKLATAESSLVSKVRAVLEERKESWDPEIQQRCLEFIFLLEDSISPEIRTKLFGPMPPFTNDVMNNSLLLKKLEGQKISTATVKKEATEGKISNVSLYKSMLTEGFNSEGSIYSDSQLRVMASVIEVTSGEQVGAVLTFKVEQNELTDIELSHKSDSSLAVMISKVKYGGDPQVMVKLTIQDSFDSPVMLTATGNCGSRKIEAEFALPVLIHRFFEKCDVDFDSQWNQLKGVEEQLKNPMNDMSIFTAKFTALAESLNLTVLQEGSCIKAAASLRGIVLVQMTFVNENEYLLSIRSNSQFESLPNDLMSLLKFYVSPK